MISPEEVLVLARLSLRLGEVERVPTHPDGVRRETDTTHSVMLALVAAEVAERLGLDPGRAALYALVHDLPEVYAGDVDTSLGLDEAARAAKEQREVAAIRRLYKELEGLYNVRLELYDYGMRFKPEAALVHLLDKAMPKAVKIVGIEDGGLPRLDLAHEEAAKSQAARLREEHPEDWLAPVHDLSDALRVRLFGGKT